MRRSAILLATVIALSVPVCAQQNPPLSDLDDPRPQAGGQPLRIAPTARPVPVPEVAPGETLTSNPVAYRKWLRRKIIEDLADLYEVTNQLVVQLAPSSAVETKLARKRADQVVKLSHNIWNNVQMRRPTRERPRPEPNASARPISASQADAIAARDLVRAIARQLADQQTAETVDVKNRVELLENLETVELIGHRIRRDVDR